MTVCLPPTADNRVSLPYRPVFVSLGEGSGAASDFGRAASADIDQITNNFIKDALILSKNYTGSGSS